MPTLRSSQLYILSSLIGLAAACSSPDNPSGTGGQTGGGGTGGTPAQPTPCEETGTCAEARSWCDPATWGGAVPTAADDVVVPDGVVLIDCEAEARTLTVAAPAALRASRTTKSSLSLHGNFIVKGTLDYGTPDDRVEAAAEIIFKGMKDSDYVGTSSKFDGEDVTNDPVVMEVIDSDVGLWIMGSGALKAAGIQKKAWSRLTDGAGPDDPSITVEDASGWLPGDKVMLTPTQTTESPDYFESFDEAEIAKVDGLSVTLSSSPKYPHAGCSGCMRRGEAGNLSRNVVIRSLDDAAHAHIMVAEQGVLQLDSVELRWLGPERPGGPSRRSPIYFHQQRGASEASFVRHSSIWGGQSGFIAIEKSDGIELTDVVGYDAAADGMRGGFSSFDEYGGAAPSGVLFTEVLAARLIPRMREEDGARIQYLLHGIACGSGAGTGCVRCVSTGVATGVDSSGFFWNNNVHLPVGPDQIFKDNVAHNNGWNGVRLWQNSETVTAPWENTQIWSSGQGLFEGAYGNAYQFGNIVIEDSVVDDAVLQAVPLEMNADLLIARLDGATLGGISISGYVIKQTNDQVFRNITFNGSKPIAVRQEHAPCEGGDETNPEDGECIRNWVRFENVSFPDGVVPFEFGWHENKFTKWEVRGFQSADASYAALPKDFDLYRKDNQVAGGSYYAAFDAWLVPQ